MRNRLGGESSPYLLQHAGNPVDWYPWGEEAFAKAREEDRPIFLSIGYSTCHWCHVMAHESFEDEGVAALLNEHFVSIKVDREERPDVDAVYMAAVQAMTGQGGWPLSVFLTPDRKPFYGGTYFPPEDGFGRPGFPSVLGGIADAWANRRDEIERSAGQVTGHLGNLSASIPEREVGEATIARAFAELAERFDAVEGGFGGAPKFPRSHSLMLLLRHHVRTGEERALEIVTTTLDHMARGGIYDHLGGGLHRYSTDRRWLVPHFEKMLYDQALAVRTYVEAYQVTGATRYADHARDILRYVLRDLREPGGAFSSAEDADSEGVEGKFYVWDHAELLDVLGEEDGRFLAGVFGAKEAGNFDEEATRRPSGKNILHLAEPLDEETAARVRPLAAKLLDVREKRVRPLLDDKVLTDWNGLMIGALATAGRALAAPEYVAAATAAADFLLENLVRDGRLLHRWRKGEASIPGFLDDYAFLAEGLLELHQATLDPRWLAESKRLLGEAVRLFAAGEAGGFCLMAEDGEELVARPREIYDGAIPSGNSVMARTLLRVGRLAMDRGLDAEGERTLRAFSGAADAAPTGYPYLLLALDFAVGPTSEIVIAGDPDDDGTAALRAEVDRRFLPRAVVTGHPAGAGAEAAEAVVPFLRELDPVEGRPAAYVCRDYACRRPVTDAAALGELLDGAGSIT